MNRRKACWNLAKVTLSGLRMMLTSVLGLPLPRTLNACCNRSVFANLSVVAETPKIEMELVKLSDGGRLLRLFDRETGMSLERKLDPSKPVLRQKNQLLAIFDAALARAHVLTA
jgi:hypothetical protein